MDMDTDIDMDMDMELGTFTQYLISAIVLIALCGMTFINISRRNFQRQYVLLATFYDEKMTCRF
jgi:hypothetical protein